MILMVVMALMTQALFIVKRLAKVETIEGRVTVQHGGAGDFVALTSADFIKTNDIISTDNDGRVELKWADGTRVKMEPNTNLAVKEANYNMARKADNSQFLLNRGTIFVRIVKALKPQSKFEIETPTAKAAVRGTIFMVKVEKGRTEVAVHKGAVRVSSGQNNQLRESYITPGKIAFSQTIGQVQVDDSHRDEAAIEAQFAAQQSIVTPTLTATIRLLSDGQRAMIQGRAEAGDTVTINSQKVPVLGNGMFLFRVALTKGPNDFKIVATDKHSATRQLVKSLSAP